MNLKTTSLIVLLVLCLAGFGCKKKGGESAEQMTLKTAAEFKQEAAKEITEKNLSDELSKLEQEVEQELDEVK